MNVVLFFKQKKKKQIAPLSVSKKRQYLWPMKTCSDLHEHLQSTENAIKIGNEVNVKEMFGLMEKLLN